jgi:hypothetical protein
MFSLPQGDDKDTDGSSEARPLWLETIKMSALVDFAFLAEFTCVRAFTIRCSLYSVMLMVTCSRMDIGAPPFSAQEWTDVLALATMWDMESRRRSIIVHLTKVFNASDAHAALQFRAAQDYEVDGWKMAGLARLISRASPLTAGEIELLGANVTAFVMRHREVIVTEGRISTLTTKYRASGRCGCSGWEPVTLCALCKDRLEKDAERTLDVVGERYIIDIQPQFD